MSDETLATAEQCSFFSEEDIVAAMREIPGYIDVTPGDFKIIFTNAYTYARKKILHGTKAGAIMRSPAICISENSSVDELIRLLAAHGISGLPVLDAAGRVTGVASEKDILRSLGRSAETRLIGLVADSLDAPFSLTREERQRSVKQIMSAPPITVLPDATLGEVIDIFHARAINRLPVVDANDAPLGLISRHNIIKSFRRLV